MTELEPVTTDASASEEVAPDAVQLMAIATFNGLCSLIAAIGASGAVGSAELADIHEGMARPLDDRDWRDDPFISQIRDSLDGFMALAVKEATFRRAGLLRD